MLKIALRKLGIFLELGAKKPSSRRNPAPNIPGMCGNGRFQGIHSLWLGFALKAKLYPDGGHGGMVGEHEHRQQQKSKETCLPCLA
jgi:hypothetical protein